MAHITGVGAFFIIVLFLVVLGCASWFIYTHLRARRLGLPQPSLSSYNPFRSSERYSASGPTQGGVVGWVSDKVRSFRNRNNRSAGGAYEEPLSSNVRGRPSNRGFGALDPDNAWDARVGAEADAYEEQELGLHPGSAPTTYDGNRGRSISREPEPYIGGNQAGLNKRYDEEMGKKPQNPFDDSAEPSNIGLRGVSLGPVDTSKGHKPHDSIDSPTERRSMFHENM